MKKFCAVVFSLLCLFVVKPHSDFVSAIGVASDDDTFIIYSHYVFDDETYDICGDGYFIYTDYASSREILIRHQDVLGQTIVLRSFDGDIDDIAMSVGAKIVHRDRVEDTEIVFGYNPSLRDYVVIDGARVNVQIATDGDFVKIGYPLILDSF